MLRSVVAWGVASGLLVTALGMTGASLGACSDFGADDGASEGSDAGGARDVATAETSLPDGASGDAEPTECDPARLATDKFNCGACGHRCEVSCSQGMCEPQVMGANLSTGAHLAVDDKDVFVSDKSNISRCANPSFGASCDWTSVAQNDTTWTSPMALGPRRLFWSTPDSLAATTGSLWSNPRDGVMVAGTISASPVAFALGANADATTVVLIDTSFARTVHAIMCDDQKCYASSVLGKNGRAVAGSTAGVCYLGTFSQGPFGLVCTAGNSEMRTVNVEQDSVGLAVGTDAVFVVSPSGITSVSGGAATSNVKHIGDVGGTGPIAVDANNIYFASLYSIYRCPVTDCSAPTKISERTGKTVMELGIGGDFVYFLESDGIPSLLRVPK
ncbi:hypothetical protein AKJ09_02441 [Labilithrix luteola]|uniref:Tryptophan synthase alpha chain n=1 Tax=Labilithrix luteola TaxID=1391654 RepID=A0A0K1PQI0_9BACT|nr:hypothetical protein [Labilithrix luteola]AKU95777.1 hypothetical protein AKJ09_02441 [Labilithrix luteola]